MLHKLFLALLLIVASATLGMAQSATMTNSALIWKLTPGRTFKIETAQEMDQQMIMAGNPMNSKSSTKTWITWAVKGVDDAGNAKVESTITRVLMNIDAPMMGQIEMDTDSDEEPTGMAKNMSQMFKPMIGIPMTQTMNARGEILDMEIPEEALKKLGESAVPGMGGADEIVKQMAKGAAIAFPEDELEIGEKFSSTAEAKTPMGSVVTTNEYTYQGETEVDNRKLHKFDVEMQMKFEAGDAQQATINVKEQDSKGTMYFDSESGRLDHSEIEQNMSADISVAGQTIAQKSTQIVTTKVTEGT